MVLWIVPCSAYRNFHLKILFSHKGTKDTKKMTSVESRNISSTVYLCDLCVNVFISLCEQQLTNVLFYLNRFWVAWTNPVCPCLSCDSLRYESYRRRGRPLSPAGGGSRGWKGTSENPGRFVT